ncbi:MAG: aminopeptidase N [Bacteriovoracaceae bacterium]|nr:aminopeptidase N [Bacteriovoracaceae bacterium]
MTELAPKTIFLNDYEKPLYTADKVHLEFELDWTQTRVTCTQSMKCNHDTTKGIRDLELTGDEFILESVKVNGEKFPHTLKEGRLVLADLPSEFDLEIKNIINPETNKALEGLYKSGNILCTQNEAEGFRRITYFQDRPDVMAVYTTKIIADKKTFPVLLSNGNKVGEGDLDNGRHFATWEDPFKKPSYLYALVAGDLGMVEDFFTTMSGRQVTLQIFCDKGSESRCDHAMQSLKKSMKWDEDKFGLEYDLDLYMIVSVDSFNAGAMENKGLNIFNSALTLASQKTATDADFLNIEGVIGHEYFHNWTGNRVTCRDWFQLTLKEGLTVFRDQEFSGDMNSRSVQRISDVGRVRAGQFPEDAGPMAHPIKPKSYISIDNFYSATVYEKGAEVIRMVDTFLGTEGFRKGMDKYFELHDGQAVTTEDFLNAMSVANNDYDFSQFIRWYDQAGTPEVSASWNYNESNKTFSLTISQSCPDTPDKVEKLPFHMPFKIGLVARDGNDMKLSLEDSSGQPQLSEGILHLRKESETFIFTGVDEKPVPSINRNFTAPVKLTAGYSDEDLVFLMANDNDEFNRFECAQMLGMIVINGLIINSRNGEKLSLHRGYSDAFGAILNDSTLKGSIKAACMSIPMEAMVTADQRPIDFPNTIIACDFVRMKLAQNHSEVLHTLYHELNTDDVFSISPEAIGKRNLKNAVLGYIAKLKAESKTSIIAQQFENATNMTDELAALSFLLDQEGEWREKAKNDFYQKYSSETLVMQKWFGTLGKSTHPDTPLLVKSLLEHAAYDKTIPNFVRSLIGSFARNSRFFHCADGSGYKFVADRIVEMDAINPSVGAGIAQAFRTLKKLPEGLQKLARVELERVSETEGLSKNTFEIITKTLN